VIGLDSIENSGIISTEKRENLFSAYSVISDTLHELQTNILNRLRGNRRTPFRHQMATFYVTFRLVQKLFCFDFYLKRKIFISFHNSNEFISITKMKCYLVELL